MTNYKFGDVVLIAFPQTTSPQPKKRPALVILDIGDADLIRAQNTSRERTHQEHRSDSRFMGTACQTDMP